jgi:hypothetical protein
MIRLGDKLTVQVAKVDTFKKQVDFRLAAEERQPAGQRPPAVHSGKPQWKNSPQSDSRQQETKPMLRTVGSQLPASPRPLLKASASRSFSKRPR